MSEPMDDVETFVTTLQAGNLSRRAILRQSVTLGLTAPVIAGLLAACGGDDDDEPTASAAPVQDPTTTSAPAEPTETPASAEPTATAAPAEPTATTPAEEPTETAEPEAQAGGGGTLKIVSWQAATILNAHLAQGGKDTFAVRIYAEPLADYDPDGNLVPFLASEIPSLENGDVAADGLSVTWRLREGVSWHDGEQFTADDVVFTWEYVTHPDAGFSTAANYTSIESIDVIDDYTVTINFVEPKPDWFTPFTGTSGTIVPQHILSDWVGATAKDAPFNLDPIGTGPFRVTEFKAADVTLFEINEDYWEAGKPFFDAVELKGGGEASTAARAVLETGDYDFAPFLQVEPQLLAEMEDAGFGTVGSTRAAAVERVVLQFSDPNIEVDGERSHISTRHPAITDPQFRQALALLADRDSIAAQLYGPAGEATANTLPGPPRFASPNTSYEFNIEKAAQTLDDAEWEVVDGLRTKGDYQTRFVFQSTVNSVRQKTQEIIKQAMEEVGIQVEIKAIDSAVYFSGDVGNPDTWTKFYADMGLWSSGASIFPLQYFQLYKSVDVPNDIPQKSNNWKRGNSSRWFGTPESDEFNSLYIQAESELDPEVQNDIFIEMNDIIVNNVVEIPLVWRFQTYAIINGITGQLPSGWSNEIWNVKDWAREE